ncbi:MAG: ATP-binding protein, partial [Planctomycetota bacterium]
MTHAVATSLPKTPTTEAALRKLVQRGEGLHLECKRSTGEMREAMQTVCAFLNGGGGIVAIGVRPDGTIEGQQVADQTLRDLAEAFDRFEPPCRVPFERLRLANRREVLLLVVQPTAEAIPFTYEGRPWKRVGSTTRKMSQEEYEQLLLERAHSRRRWENQVADEVTIQDIDRDEVFRIVGIAASLGRIRGPVGRNLPGVLDRLGLRKDGKLLRAAVVLFGKTFLPDYPQCELRLARFRGTDKEEFLDQRSVRGPAFQLLEEAEIFCQRHFPMPAKMVSGQMRRQEKPLIPIDALREILVNALIHRDYTIAGGAVSLAIFDDRVEVWSAGGFPRGITPESLSQEHLSVPRNPILADVFHRTGLIERWGRGTNRVVAMCKDAGIAPPSFREITGAAVVTFAVSIGGAVG